jgi:hypothetical protein
MKTLLGSSLPEVFSLLPLISEPSLFLESFFLLSLKVKLLVGGFEIIDEIGFGILKSVLHHASHSVELLGLLGVKIFFVFLLFSLLSFLLNLLIEPLFLFILKKLSS